MIYSIIHKNLVTKFIWVIRFSTCWNNPKRIHNYCWNVCSTARTLSQVLPPTVIINWRTLLRCYTNAHTHLINPTVANRLVCMGSQSPQPTKLEVFFLSWSECTLEAPGWLSERTYMFSLLNMSRNSQCDAYNFDPVNTIIATFWACPLEFGAHALGVLISR